MDLQKKKNLKLAGTERERCRCRREAVQSPERRSPTPAVDWRREAELQERERENDEKEIYFCFMIDDMRF